jgi:hypothetical protein
MVEAKMLRFVATSLVALTLIVPNAHAAGLSDNLSNASRNLSSASGLVVTGSMQTIAASGQVVVAGLEVSGETAILVLRGIAVGTEATVRVSSEMLVGLGIAVGTMVTVVAETAGYALVAGGKVLAFLPNEASQSLLHQSRVGAR